MQWFTALIPAYAEVQQKAQEELDRVVGRSRLPMLQDEGSLPYIHAIIKEVERCHNPFWLGTPHTATQEFTYKGQFIPKDTVVVLNTYTMHHKEGRYPDSVAFNPDRYMSDSLSSSESSKLNDANERDHWMFGAGYVYVFYLYFSPTHCSTCQFSRRRKASFIHDTILQLTLIFHFPLVLVELFRATA